MPIWFPFPIAKICRCCGAKFSTIAYNARWCERCRRLSQKERKAFRHKPSLCQLKITLLEIEPPIWRRTQVPSTLPLSCLHDVFEAVMGWTDSHLHQFEQGGKYWGVPEHYEDDDIQVIDESKVPVSKVLKNEGDALVYLYDFGDNWRHEVVLEKILPAEEVATKPVCIGGQRRCPPDPSIATNPVATGWKCAGEPLRII